MVAMRFQNLRECRQGEVRRTPLSRTPVDNEGVSGAQTRTGNDNRAIVIVARET
jgi:hypothetical protein